MPSQQTDPNDPPPVMVNVPRSNEEKIAFRKWWDRQVDRSQKLTKEK